jgi:DNA-binding transcriptional ArsR family regulator
MTDDRVADGRAPDGPAVHEESPKVTAEYPRPRRMATVEEAKALAHPLRTRILRLCGQQELTNKQLAVRLDRDPGTIYYHVRLLVDAGLLEPAEVRTGESGALEKPYRSSGASWWLSNPSEGAETHPAVAPLAAFEEELRESGPDSVATFARFALHLSEEDLRELDRRILAVLDEYVDTEDRRRDQPAYGGVFILHRLAD